MGGPVLQYLAAVGPQYQSLQAARPPGYEVFPLPGVVVVHLAGFLIAADISARFREYVACRS